jgi:GNAT superfamily N-acetyltransferase
MRLVTAEPGKLLDAVFADLLRPAFLPDELGTAAELRASVRHGVSHVIVAEDDDGTPVAAAVGEWSKAGRIMLLAYMAVNPHRRSAGVGGELLEYALQTWRDEFAPCAVLAEIEHPSAHPGTASRGDPVARLRFYLRHGGRALAVPYFQPALGPGRSRVYGMILAALWVGPDGAGPLPGTVDPVPIRRYLREYFEETEGEVPDDPPTRALFEALARPDGVPLLPLDEPAGLPISAPG